ncbi:hypothetical protein EMCRGX_G010102 [Ephydatia muelleri]
MTSSDRVLRSRSSSSSGTTSAVEIKLKKSRTSSIKRKASCRLTQSDPIWSLAIFQCTWEREIPPKERYGLKNVISGNWENESDSVVLCKWLIGQVAQHLKDKLKVDYDSYAQCVASQGEEDAKKHYYDSGDAYYLLDQSPIPLIDSMLEPFTSSVDMHPDVGIVYNRCCVLHNEIQSSPMENSVAKLAANIIDQLRFVRHYVPSASSWVGFAFPKSAEESGYVCEVTVEVKNLFFVITAKSFQKTELTNIKDRLKKVTENQMKIAENFMAALTSKSNQNVPEFLLPYEKSQLITLRQLLNDQLMSKGYEEIKEELDQVESRFSLVFTDHKHYYFKYTPHFAETLVELTLHRLGIKGSNFIVYPTELLAVGDKKAKFFLYERQEHQLVNFRNSELKPYLCSIAAGIKHALDEFHKCGYAHLDVRTANVCYHQSKVTLIDLDRAVPCSETSVKQYGNSFMYTFPEKGDTMTAELLDWKQLGLLIYSILEGDTCDQMHLMQDDLKKINSESLIYSLVNCGKWKETKDLESFSEPLDKLFSTDTT